MSVSRNDTIIDELPVGYAYHQILCDAQGKPIDYVFLDVNAAFEVFTGLRKADILGKRVTEVIPGILQDKFNWVGQYGNIALNGGSMEFEQYTLALGKWYRVNVLSPQRFHFITYFVDITSEVKRINENKVLLTALNDAVVEISESFVVENIITPQEEILFFPREQMLGKSVQEIFGPETSKQILDKLSLAKSTQRKLTFDYPSLVTGDHRWFRASLRYLTLNDKQAYYVSISDISREKKHELELERFFSVNLDLLCIADAHGRFVKTNSAWERVLGYPQSYLEGKSFEAFLHPDDMPAMQTIFAQLHSQQQVLDFTNRFRCEQGGYRFFEWRAVLVDQMIYGAARDVTQRKTMEEALYIEKIRYQTTLWSIGDGVISVNQDQRITFINHIAENLTGWSQEEALDQLFEHVFIIVSDTTGERAPNPIEKVLSTGKTMELGNHLSLVAKDGTHRPIEDSAAPIRDMAGQVTGVVLIFRDVTAKRLHELETMRYRALLEEKNALQEVLSEISASFITVSMTDFDVKIQHALERIGRFVHVDRAYIFDYQFDLGICSNTYEWCNDGIEPQITTLQQIPLEMISVWVENHRAGKTMYVPDVSTLPPESQARILLEQQGVQSIITFPMMKDHDCVGFVGFDSVVRKHTFSDTEQYLLRELATLFLNAIGRRDLEKEVIYLSLHDQLTGVYNRRYFDEELLRLNTARNLPVSLVMIDVNGLKLTNDAFGHLMGDRVLIRTTDIVKRELRSDDILARIGGDEFIILLPKTDAAQAEAIAKRVQFAFRDETVDPISLSVSLGWATKTNIETPMDAVFKQAEDFMYTRKLSESTGVQYNTLSVILKTLYEKSVLEENHANRVSAYCEQIGNAMHLDEAMIRELSITGLMHDIGKISISEKILNKPTTLTSGEVSEMRRHSEIGYRILSSVKEYARLAKYVLSQHEHWDGKGYPNGLKGKDIPLPARIVAIADAYDSMISQKPYRAAITQKKALEEIAKNAGTQFDPDIAAVFIQSFQNSRPTK